MRVILSHRQVLRDRFWCDKVGWLGYIKWLHSGGNQLFSFLVRNGEFFPCMEIELFCSCLMPESYDDMVEWDDCGEWYHLKCVGLQKLPSISEQWKCSNCMLKLSVFYCILVIVLYPHNFHSWCMPKSCGAIEMGVHDSLGSLEWGCRIP